MLLKYVKRGLILSNDSLTTSIIGSKISKGGLARLSIWYYNVSISNGEILSIVCIDGSGLGWWWYALLLLIEIKNGSVSKSLEFFFVFVSMF